MIDSRGFIACLKENSFYFFSGVPCSILKVALKHLIADKEVKYVPAPREDIAIGVASGAYLTGKKSAILIQNSGLGHIINALTSFNLIYKIPVLILITWRGYQGKDAPEHKIMGRKTTKLLKNLGIPYKVLSSKYPKDIEWALTLMERRGLPVAFIIKDKVLV